MVKMINAWTKTEMFVAEDRVDEYLAAGCILAVKPAINKAESVKEEPKKAEPKAEPKKAPVKKAPAKRTVKKATAKK